MGNTYFFFLIKTMVYKKNFIEKKTYVDYVKIIELPVVYT